MIDEVVNSIIDAEDEAKRRTEEAEAKAAEIIAQAEHEAEAIRHEGAKEAKLHYQQQMAQADQEARALAAEYLQKRKAQTDAVL